MISETISTDNFLSTAVASEVPTNTFPLLKSLDLSLLPQDTWFHRCIYYLNNLDVMEAEKSINNEINEDDERLANIPIVNDSKIAIMKRSRSKEYRVNTTNCLLPKKLEMLNQLNDILSMEEHVEQNKLLLDKLLYILEIHKKQLLECRNTQLEKSVKQKHQVTQTAENSFSFDKQHASHLEIISRNSCTNLNSSPFLNKLEGMVNSTEISLKNYISEGDNKVENDTKSKTRRKQGKPKKVLKNKSEPIIKEKDRVSNEIDQRINKSGSSKKDRALKTLTNRQTRGRKRKLETSQSIENKDENIDSGTPQFRRSERIRTQVPKERWSIYGTYITAIFPDTKKNRKLYASLLVKKKRSKSLGDKSKVLQDSNSSGEQSTTIGKRRQLYSLDNWVSGLLEKF